MNYYQFHIGDYRGATAHLSNDEDLCYRRLLDLYYDKDGELPEDDIIARRVRMPIQIVHSILQEFFIETDHKWHHSRAQKEIEAYLKQKDHGKKGAEARWGKDGVAIGPPCQPHKALNATPMPTINHKPITNNHPTVEEEKNSVEVNSEGEPPQDERKSFAGALSAQQSLAYNNIQDRFKAFWDEYPENRRKNLYRAQSAFSAALHVLPDQEKLLKSLRAFKASKEWKQEGGKFIPSPETWISEHRWQDAPAFSEKPKPKPKQQVSEEKAYQWRAEKYPDSILINPTASDFPFRNWPQSVQEEYLNDQKQTQTK